jgi:predicted transcriptional regulator
MKKTNRPTSAELEILTVLWEKGEATVRDVHQVIDARKPTAYTTVLKLMQIMDEKGLVERDRRAKAHIYRPTLPEGDTQTTLVTDLLEKAFHGSALRLVQHVLETKPATEQELKEIRKLIREAEKNIK